jgi:hypothetical protein
VSGAFITQLPAYWACPAAMPAPTSAAAQTIGQNAYCAQFESNSEHLKIWYFYLLA